MDATPAERAELWRLLFITTTAVLNTVEAELKAAEDLTLLDIGCLFALASAGDGGRSMGALAELFAVDPSVITYRIKRLEGRGVVVRQPRPDNRRIVHAYLTPAGREHLRRARGVLLTSADRHFFAHLAAGSTDALRRSFSALLTAQQAGRGVSAPQTQPEPPGCAPG